MGAPRVGDVRVGDGRDYERPGFPIEHFNGEGWAVPAWDDAGYPRLCGFHPTPEAAADALRLYGIDA